MEQLQSDIGLTASSYMTLQLLHSEFPYIYEENFILFFLSAYNTVQHRERKTPFKDIYSRMCSAAFSQAQDSPSCDYVYMYTMCGGGKGCWKVLETAVVTVLKTLSLANLAGFLTKVWFGLSHSRDSKNLLEY